MKKIDAAQKTETASGGTVKIIACSCSHDYQDAVYGKGNRTHNKTEKGWRCTVCKAEK